MLELIMQVIIGVIIIGIGVLQMKGNLSLLHSYHRNRVKEEDKLPFGKTVGFGTIIIGATIVLASIVGLFYPSALNVVLALGFVPGFIIIFYALLKYNKGIF